MKRHSISYRQWFENGRQWKLKSYYASKHILYHMSPTRQLQIRSLVLLLRCGRLGSLLLLRKDLFSRALLYSPCVLLSGLYEEKTKQ